MPVKVLDSEGSGSLYDVAQGIEWATDHGANVINLSLGSVYDSSRSKTRSIYAYDEGVLVVAAGATAAVRPTISRLRLSESAVLSGAYDQGYGRGRHGQQRRPSQLFQPGQLHRDSRPGSSVYSTYYAADMRP